MHIITNFLHRNNVITATLYIFSSIYMVAKVHELITVKVLRTSLVNRPWSPSKYYTWEAMQQCQRLVHPSKQFWNWFGGMAFRAAVLLPLMSSMSSKYLPYNISPIFGNGKKSLGARSDE